MAPLEKAMDDALDDVSPMDRLRLGEAFPTPPANAPRRIQTDPSAPFREGDALTMWHRDRREYFPALVTGTDADSVDLIYPCELGAPEEAHLSLHWLLSMRAGGKLWHWSDGHAELWRYAPGEAPRAVTCPADMRFRRGEVPCCQWRDAPFRPPPPVRRALDAPIVYDEEAEAEYARAVKAAERQQAQAARADEVVARNWDQRASERVATEARARRAWARASAATPKRPLEPEASARRSGRRRTFV